MLSFTVRIDEGGGTRRVQVSGSVDVHNATELTHMLKQLSDAVGSHAAFDLTGLSVLDHAGWAAVRSFQRDTQEFGGSVSPPVAAGA